MIPELAHGAFFTGIPADQIDLYEELLLPLVAKPLERTDVIRYITPEQVLDKCRSRDWQCWIAHDGENIDAAFFTYINEHPTGYKSFVVDLVGGYHLYRWLDVAWETFKDYAGEQGCGEIIGAGRKGWTRVIGKMDQIEDMTRWRVEL